MCNTLVSHNSLNICEVQIDDRRNVDQVCNSLYGLLQNFIRLLERFRKCGPSVHDLEKSVIGNDDQGIDVILDVLDADKRPLHTALRFKAERLCHNTDSEDAHFLGNFRNNRSRASAGAAAHAAGYEYHVRTLDGLRDLICALFCCFLTDLRNCARSKTLGQLLSNLQKSGSSAKIQRLHICIHADELYACYIYIYHSVNSVVACAANANDYYLASRFRIICLDFQHGWPLLIEK